MENYQEETSAVRGIIARLTQQDSESGLDNETSPGE